MKKKLRNGLPFAYDLALRKGFKVRYHFVLDPFFQLVGFFPGIRQTEDLDPRIRDSDRNHLRGFPERIFPGGFIRDYIPDLDNMRIVSREFFADGIGYRLGPVKGAPSLIGPASRKNILPKIQHHDHALPVEIHRVTADLAGDIFKRYTVFLEIIRKIFANHRVLEPSIEAPIPGRHVLFQDSE